MKIAPGVLLAQYLRFSAQFPWVGDVEAEHGLPPFTLFAVASRETNMTVEVGDGGHGHGPWQFDDRTPGRGPAIARIDGGDIRFAADVAAGMLADEHARTGDWVKAFNVYNSGQTRTEHTADGDYGPDVAARLAWLQANVADPTPPNPQPVAEDDMPVAFDPINGDFWVLTGPDGGIDARRADGSTSRRYYGNLIDHPEYNAGAGKPLGPAIGIGYWPAGQPVSGEPAGGYVIITRAPDGTYHPYHFDATTVKTVNA